MIYSTNSPLTLTDSSFAQEIHVCRFRKTSKSQGPDLNRRWAALQAAAFGRTLPPWRIFLLLLRSFKHSGTDQPRLEPDQHIRRKLHTATANAVALWSYRIEYEWRRRIDVPRGSPTPVLADTQASLSSVFGMGTGGTSPLWPP